MKLIKILSLALVMLMGKTIFAGEPAVPAAIMQRFHTTFHQAVDVQWTVIGQLTRAQFLENNRNVYAYFESDGTLSVTAYELPAVELPATLQHFPEFLSGYHLINCFRLVNEKGVEYVAGFSNGKKLRNMISDGKSWRTAENLL
jgi:hypothetical protein